MACALQPVSVSRANHSWQSVGRGPVEKESKSCFAVLSFCATVATVAAFALAILVASATLAFALANRLESPAWKADATVTTAEASALPAATSYPNQAAQKSPVLTAKGQR